MAHKTSIKYHSSIIESEKINGWIIPAVNDIVEDYPSEPADGDRIILTSDNKIYTYNESYLIWQEDSQTKTLINGLGVVLENDEDFKIYVYLSSEGSWVDITGECIITQDVTSSLSSALGGIDPLQVVPEGTTLTQFVQLLLTKIYYPTYSPTNPTVSVTSNKSEGECGEVLNFTLTVTYNRNNILGKIVGGVWSASAFQNYRSGAATGYIIDGISTGLTNNKSLTKALVEGSNTYNGSVNYGVGAQPVDSIGQNFETPLGAGSLSGSRTIQGRRKAFWESKVNDIQPDGIPDTSVHIRALSNSLLNPQAWVVGNPTFTIDVHVNDTIVIFAYPKSLGLVGSVLHREDSNSEIKNAFTKIEFGVEGANSYTAVIYYVYYYIPDIPLIANEHFDVFI